MRFKKVILVDYIITKIKKIIFFSFFIIALQYAFSEDDNSVIVQAYESSGTISQSDVQENVVEAQQQISQEYNAKEAYYNYCSLYSMYDFDDPMYGYGIPVWSSGADECNYGSEDIEPSDSSSGNPTEDYPNIHQEKSGEVIFGQ